MRVVRLVLVDELVVRDVVVERLVLVERLVVSTPVLPYWFDSHTYGVRPVKYPIPPRT